jgi:hypothetical protein
MTQAVSMISMDTDTETIYARVPAALKAQVQEYAAERRLSLAQAVTWLLAEGLEAPARRDRTDELERRVTELERYAARP